MTSINESAIAERFTADLDNGATSTETTEVQALFDQIGVPVTVTATYSGKSAAGTIEHVLWVVGSGVGLVILNGVRTFLTSATTAAGTKIGEKVGEYTGDGMVAWLKSLRGARASGELPVIVQDRSLALEIRFTGEEPAEAFTELHELIETGKIKELPGKINEVTYDPETGHWKRTL